MKKAKFILPTVAIVFAVAGVFATENFTGNFTPALVPLQASLNPVTCVLDGECSNVPPSACTTSSGVVLKIKKINGTCPDDGKGQFTYYN